MQVKEERHPGCRLVFRHRRNNWNVDFGVARIPEWVKSSTPWCYVTCTNITCILNLTTTRCQKSNT